MSDHFDRLSKDARARLRPTPQPDWIDPMLATLSDRPFSDPNWLFEAKLDGYRCLAFVGGDGVRLLSRARQPLAATFPEVVDHLAGQGLGDVVLDGEVVAMEGGRSSFARLQQRAGIKDPGVARRSPVAVEYHVFDLLHLDGFDTRDLGLRDRKRLLRHAVVFGGPLRRTVHRNERGEEYFAQACRRGLEGVVAKRADARYVSRRGRSWLKFKCAAEQELVVGGYTDPAGARVGFGALLVGYYEGDRLRYAGKVGTGFDTGTLLSLRRLLDDHGVARSPFVGGPRWPRGTHFVAPVLVAQVAFTEWTRDGLLRQPRFLGLREDKAARDVVRERATGGSPRS